MIGRRRIFALVAAAAALAGCAHPAASREAAETSWGPGVSSLRIRVDAPSTAACGDRIAVDVFADRDPEAAGTPATLTSHHPAVFVRMRLRPHGGGDDVVLRAEDPTVGPPEPPPPDGAPRDVVPVPGARLVGVQFPLAAAWDRLVPGAYDGVVELVHDGSVVPEHDAERTLGGTLRGTLVSQPVRLEIRPAPERLLEVRVPAALLGGDVDGRLQLPVRNGFTVGLTFTGELGDGTTGGLHEGAPSPGMFDDELAAIAAAPGPASFTIFETAESPGYHRSPGPRSPGYRVLFRSR